MSAASSDPSQYTFAQLVRAVGGLSERTIRYYFDRGVVPKPPFRSSKTRYSADHVLRLRAAARLRKRRVGLDEIAEQLEAATLEELYQLAGMEPPEAPEDDEPEDDEPEDDAPQDDEPAPTPEAQPGLPDSSFLGRYRAQRALTGERWEIIGICPGVQLMVRTEADTEAWRVASEIIRLFGGQE